MEVHVPNEQKRIDSEFMLKSKLGILKNNFTPSDVKGFLPVSNPIIRNRYHISWAYSGAVFVLKQMNEIYAYLDNPRYKRKTLIKCKLTELRALNKPKNK